jgi:serine-aspartate repeat-containing protein C/D/E
MAITRYGTSVTLCEDTRQTFELYDLLKQADPNYSAVEPARITLYVFNGSTWVTVSAPGFFSAVDKDTFVVDMSYLPNFNGIQQVRVLGSDSSGNSFILNLTINVTPVNDAPTGEDETVALANGDSYVLGLADFGFNDPVEGDAFKSVVFTTVPAHGALLLDGVAVTAGQEILASDIEAGKLSYTAPVDAGGPISFDFQVRDTGGTDGCGGNDLDLTPNTITFNVPYPATAIIGDRVWEDTNANGVQDAGETGLAGVTVATQGRRRQHGGPPPPPTPAATTASRSMPAPTRSPSCPRPATKSPRQDMGRRRQRWTATSTTPANSALVTVSRRSQQHDHRRRPVTQLAELGDRVWLDTNGNGQQDTGEAGVARRHRAPSTTPAGDLVDAPRSTTDADGNYLFTNLRPGTYSVQFDKTTLPAGYSFTTANSGSDATDSDANSLDGKTIQTVLDSGESDRTWDAGIVANPGAITGTVLEDLDHNGTGDTPIAGVTVVLKDASGAPIATTTTDANGNYSFANVPAGNYTVEQTNKRGLHRRQRHRRRQPQQHRRDGHPRHQSGQHLHRRAPAGQHQRHRREDLDNNNTGDTPIAGVTVVLKDASGAPMQRQLQLRERAGR